MYNLPIAEVDGMWVKQDAECYTLTSHFMNGVESSLVLQVKENKDQMPHLNRNKDKCS